MARYFMDFRDDVIGEVPSGFRYVGELGPNRPPVVVDDVTSPFGRAVKNNSRNAWYNPWGHLVHEATADIGSADAEVAILAAHTYIRAAVRVNELQRSSYQAGYYYSNYYQLWKGVGDSGGSQVVLGTWTRPSSDLFWVRLRVSGETLYAKTWAYGGVEPEGWDITVTDTEFSAGGLGVYFVNTDAPLYAVGIGTYGDSAPLEPVDDPGAIQFQFSLDTTRLVRSGIQVGLDTRRGIVVPDFVGADALRRVVRMDAVELDAERRVLAEVSVGMDTKRRTMAREVVEFDTIRRVSGPLAAVLNTKRVVRASVSVTLDTMRQVIQAGSFLLPLDTVRKVQVRETSVSDTMRRVGVQDAVETDTKRAVKVEEQVATDAVRRVYVQESVVADTQRKAVVAEIVGMDTQRRTSVTVSQRVDSLRTVRAVVSVLLDTMRRVVVPGAFSILVDTRREVQDVDVARADTKRRTSVPVSKRVSTLRRVQVLASVLLDTMRQVIVPGGFTLSLDTKREVQSQEIVRAEAKRRVAVWSQVQADIQRRVVVQDRVQADVKREVHVVHRLVVDTVREVRRLVSILADTLRVLVEGALQYRIRVLPKQYAVYFVGRKVRVQVVSKRWEVLGLERRMYYVGAVDDIVVQVVSTVPGGVIVVDQAEWRLIDQRTKEVKSQGSCLVQGTEVTAHVEFTNPGLYELEYRILMGPVVAVERVEVTVQK